MFDIGLGEMVTLAVVALLVFGPERLPEVAVKAAHFVRRMRGVAASARSELSTSFGTDLDELRDLDPRTFVRRHVLDPADEDGTLRDLRANGRRARKSVATRQGVARAVGLSAEPDGPGTTAVGTHTSTGAGAGPTARTGASGTGGAASTAAGLATSSAAATGPAVPPAMRPAPLAVGELPPYDDEAT